MASPFLLRSSGMLSTKIEFVEKMHRPCVLLSAVISLQYLARGGYMIRAVILAVISVAAAGCTSTHLKNNTLALGSTITPFQYEQVLNNIAMLTEHEWALPSQVRLQSAQSQVSDKVDPAGKFGFGGGGDKQPTQELDLGYERGWFDSWTVVPVTDPKDLRRLQRLYRYAMQPTTDGYTKIRESLLDSKDAPETSPLSPGWYKVGTNAPRGAFSGSFGNTKIWVEPGHEKELSEFTLLVLGSTPVAVQKEMMNFGFQRPLLVP